MLVWVCHDCAYNISTLHTSTWVSGVLGMETTRSGMKTPHRFWLSNPAKGPDRLETIARIVRMYQNGQLVPCRCVLGVPSVPCSNAYPSTHTQDQACCIGRVQTSIGRVLQGFCRSQVDVYTQFVIALMRGQTCSVSCFILIIYTILGIVTVLHNNASKQLFIIFIIILIT